MAPPTSPAGGPEEDTGLLARSCVSHPSHRDLLVSPAHGRKECTLFTAAHPHATVPGNRQTRSLMPSLASSTFLHL